MVCHRYRCVFVEQRKAASCSILRAFDGDGVEPRDRHRLRDGLLSAGWGDLPTGYLTFGVVRNPWDKFISAWKFLGILRRRSLVELLREPPRPMPSVVYEHMWRPQHEILCTPSGALGVDRLLRFEDLQAGFDEVCDLIGKARVELLRLNRTAHDEYTSYYDAETRGLLAERFARDIELFGYTFGPSPCPSRS